MLFCNTFRALDLLMTKGHITKVFMLISYYVCFIVVLEALNMEKMMSAISCYIESPQHPLVSTDLENAEEIPILIIEGFFLFNYKQAPILYHRL